MKMKISFNTIRGWIAVAALVLCTGLGIAAQDSSGQSPSLGDVARKTRKENSAPGHVVGKTLVNEEEDGPDTTGVWRVRLCTRTPCYELAVNLPKDAKWTRVKDEPRPVLIPLPGQEKDAGHVIRLYVAEALGTNYYSPLDGAKRLFLQGWFSRPEYFGQAARIGLDEHVQVDTASALISHFTIAGGETRYRGLSIVAASPNGNYGFACVYRDEDASVAGSICDAIVKSARTQALEPGRRPFYPNYQPPTYYPYYPRIDDPRIEPPGNDDPED
jgi:hypothetical protein